VSWLEKEGRLKAEGVDVAALICALDVARARPVTSERMSHLLGALGDCGCGHGAQGRELTDRIRGVQQEFTALGTKPVYPAWITSASAWVTRAWPRPGTALPVDLDADAAVVDLRGVAGSQLADQVKSIVSRESAGPLSPRPRDVPGPASNADQVPQSSDH